jgi:hypothetical protein
MLLVCIHETMNLCITHCAHPDGYQYFQVRFNAKKLKLVLL